MRHEIRTPRGTLRTVDITPLEAIRLFCRECRGWEARLFSSDCGQSDRCHLYPFRNGRRQKGAGSVLQTIKRECRECSGSNVEVDRCTDENCALFLYRKGRNPARQGIGGKGRVENLRIGMKKRRESIKTAQKTTVTVEAGQMCGVEAKSEVSRKSVNPLVDDLSACLKDLLSPDGKLKGRGEKTT